MSRSRSHTVPLFASYLLLASVFFATIELGVGLSCYACSASVTDSSCADKPKETSIVKCPFSLSDPKTKARTVIEDKKLGNIFPAGAESLSRFLRNGTYATERNYACYKAHLTATDGVSVAIERGCIVPTNSICAQFLTNNNIKTFEYSICDSDKCNSSGTIKIGAISLLVPLIASLVRTR